MQEALQRQNAIAPFMSSGAATAYAIFASHDAHGQGGSEGHGAASPSVLPVNTGAIGHLNGHANGDRRQHTVFVITVKNSRDLRHRSRGRTRWNRWGMDATGRHRDGGLATVGYR